MLVEVNGAKLFVDIEGAGLVPDGPVMRQKRTLVLLHGGPGFDHSMFRPDFTKLSDVAQIVYLDHRGNGRSSRGDPADWNLAQWGDDVRGLCEVLGIVKPVVLGFSFGGFVAQSYATRHPAHPGRLILCSTAATMGAGSAGTVDEDGSRRMIFNKRVENHFQREQATMDFRPALRRIRCPVLVMAGGKDDAMPEGAPQGLMDGLKPGRGQLQIIPGAGHGVYRDTPVPFFKAVRAFLAG